MNRAGRVVRGFVKVVGGAAKALLKFAAAAGTAGGVLGFFALRTFTRFEKAMADVISITRDGEENFQRLEDAARQLGRTTQFTASDVARAQKILAIAGLKTTDILAALSPVLKLAVAGTLDIADASDKALRIMGGFGISAQGLKAVMETLARGFTSANLTLQDLGVSMRFIAPIAKTVGRDLQETTAILLAFAKGGIRGSRAGTALRMIFIRLAAQPGRVGKELKRLNIETRDSLGNMIPFADIIDQLNDRLKNVGNSTKLATLAIIAGARAASALAVAMESGGDQIREFDKALRASGNTLDQITSVQMDTMFGALKRVTSAFKGLEIAVGGILIVFARPFTEAIAKAINIVEEFVIRNRLLFDDLIRRMGGVIIIAIKALDSFGIWAKLFKFLGVTGKTSFQVLIRILAIFEGLLANVTSLLSVFRLAAERNFAKIGDFAATIFLDIIPTIFSNSLKFMTNIVKKIVSIFSIGFNTVAEVALESFITIFASVNKLGFAIRRSFKFGFGLISVREFTKGITTDIKSIQVLFETFTAGLELTLAETSFNIAEELSKGFTAGLKELPKIDLALADQIGRELDKIISVIKKDIKAAESALGIFDPQFDLPKFENIIKFGVRDGTTAGLNEATAAFRPFKEFVAPLIKGTPEAFAAVRGISRGNLEKNAQITADQNKKQTELLSNIEDALSLSDFAVDIF